jgi:membrane protein YdbS with pleckstrin-like domain
VTDPYIKRLLGDREKIILTTHQHWSQLVQNILPEIVITLIILAIIGVVFVVILPNQLVFLGALVLLIPITSLVRDVMIWSNHQYIVTNRRVIQIFGVINKNVTDSSLEKVNDVKMEQSFLGRIFNYGDVEILTASELGINRFTKIGNPIAFKTAMLNAKEQLEQVSIPKGFTPPSSSDIPELISRLAKLHQDGVLSDAEFTEKKAKLLAKL